MGSLLLNSVIQSIEAWIADLEDGRRTGQIEASVEHTVATMTTAVHVLRELAQNQPDER